MKFLLTGLLVIGSLVTHAADSYLFECHSKAVAAANAIDSLNFESQSRSSVVVSDRSQKKTSAKIDVSFDEANNRRYTVRVSKNRGASLQGNTIQEELGCSIETVDVN